MAQFIYVDASRWDSIYEHVSNDFLFRVAQQIFFQFSTKLSIFSPKHEPEEDEILICLFSFFVLDL